jgi:hypothetical protein
MKNHPKRSTHEKNIKIHAKKKSRLCTWINFSGATLINASKEA